ncbi:HTH-type transcriptional regulator EthR [Thalassocella blandensis]|nr:HTH-type transcriptional regulator EthR [Thalassocella blandensis]
MRHMTESQNFKILREAQNLILKHGFKKVTMTDVASACQISRTTLYKSFPNKESIIVGLINESLDECVKKTNAVLNSENSVKRKLEDFFNIWTIAPAASVIELETGRDILLNVANYAPAAVENHYLIFEKMLAKLIKSHTKRKKGISANDLARILTLASKELKASAEDIKDLTRMVGGLIEMAVATIETNSR